MNYGVDWTEPIPDSDDSEQVHVSEVDRPVSISDDELEHLRQLYTLDKIISSDYHASDLYIDLLARVFDAN